MEVLAEIGEEKEKSVNQNKMTKMLLMTFNIDFVYSMDKPGAFSVL